MFVLLSFAGSAWAEDAAKPPEITDSVRAAYWRAQAGISLATVGEHDAKAVADKIILQMRLICGDDFALSDKPNGEPRCVAPPKPRADPTKPWWVHDDAGNVMGPHPSEAECKFGAVSYGFKTFTCTQESN